MATTTPDILSGRQHTGIGAKLGAAARWVVRGRADSAVWDLSASGCANFFSSAAAQAGSANWEAFFSGSSDAANSITVDKPPMSLWFMALSIRPGSRRTTLPPRSTA